MTAREHCERVKFEFALVDRYIPNNKFKRIYPYDRSMAGVAENGDDLGDLYRKLEKSSALIWKKIAGMNNKKQEEKLKKKKTIRLNMCKDDAVPVKKKLKKKNTGVLGDKTDLEDDEAIEICDKTDIEDDNDIDEEAKLVSRVNENDMMQNESE